MPNAAHNAPEQAAQPNQTSSTIFSAACSGRRSCASLANQHTLSTRSQDLKIHQNLLCHYTYEQPWVYNALGKSYCEKKDYEQGISLYSKAIKLEPTNGIYYFGRGCCYQYMGDNQNALKDYDKSIELNPLHIESYDNRGIIVTI